MPFRIATKLQPSSAALQTAAAAGFRAAEFWTDGAVFERPETLVETARRFDFAYVIHFPNHGGLADTTLENAARIYRTLGCRAMVIHRPMYERYGEALMSLDADLRLGVENHRLDRQQFEQWAERNRWLTLDIEHLWKFTLEDAPLGELVETLADFLARHVAKLVHVHLPGYQPGYEEHRPMYCSRELVFAALTLLANAGFDGLVVSEAAPKYQNIHELSMDVLLAKRWRQLRGEADNQGSTESDGR